ncbi:MAG: hypothetical protein V4689_20615 [Verrucomicrobiota bacterium]
MKSFCSLLVLFFPLCAPLFAKQITVSFEAKVDSLNDPKGIFTGRVGLGGVITGKFTYTTGAADENDWTQVGDYYFSSVPNGMSVNAGNILVSTKPAGDMLIEISDNGNDIDYFAVNSNENFTTHPSLEVSTIAFNLIDHSLKAISSDALPTALPSLSDYDESTVFFYDDSSQNVLNARITRIALGDSLFRPLINLLPASGEMMDTQLVEPVVKVDVGSFKDARIEAVRLDGKDVTASFLETSRSGLLAGDQTGKTWQFSGIYLKEGPHKLEVKVGFASGVSSWGSADWQVLHSDLKKVDSRFATRVNKDAGKVGGKP